MTSTETLEIITQLQNKQRSIKITLGAVIGILLLFYFFSFAMLADKFPPMYFVIQGFVAVILVAILFNLNRLSFAWVCASNKNKPERTAILAKLKPADVDEKPEKLLQSIQEN